jgi:hypothetical protein
MADVRLRIIELRDECEFNGVDLTDLVMEKWNCYDVSFDADGDIWIADPQQGHWLSDADLQETVDWIEAWI